MTTVKQYQVVGECAYVTVDTAVGRAKTLLYKGAPVSADAPELQHLLAAELVAQVGGDVGPGVNAAGELGPAEPPPVVTPSGDVVDPEVEVRRAEAKAKLPADGSAPDGRASAEVWIEYAVAQGLDRGEATKAGKDELRKALAGGK